MDRDMLLTLLPKLTAALHTPGLKERMVSDTDGSESALMKLTEDAQGEVFTEAVVPNPTLSLPNSCMSPPIVRLVGW